MTIVTFHSDLPAGPARMRALAAYRSDVWQQVRNLGMPAALEYADAEGCKQRASFAKQLLRAVKAMDAMPRRRRDVRRVSRGIEYSLLAPTIVWDYGRPGEPFRARVRAVDGVVRAVVVSDPPRVYPLP